MSNSTITFLWTSTVLISELKLFLFVELKLFLFIELNCSHLWTSTVLIRWTQLFSFVNINCSYSSSSTVLIRFVELNCSYFGNINYSYLGMQAVLFCEHQLFLSGQLNCSDSANSTVLNTSSSTLSAGPFSFLSVYFEKSPSVALFINAYTLKSSVILYSALFKNVLYPVSRVYTTLSTLYSALLCNSEILLRILITWLCTVYLLKRSSPYFRIFLCYINLFTLSATASLTEWNN